MRNKSVDVAGCSLIDQRWGIHRWGGIEEDRAAPLEVGRFERPIDRAVVGQACAVHRRFSKLPKFDKSGESVRGGREQAGRGKIYAPLELERFVSRGSIRSRRKRPGFLRELRYSRRSTVQSAAEILIEAGHDLGGCNSSKLFAPRDADNDAYAWIDRYTERTPPGPEGQKRVRGIERKYWENGENRERGRAADRWDDRSPAIAGRIEGLVEKVS